MDYMFSIHPQYANKIFSGEKTIELRRGRVNLTVPGQIWIYVTSPDKALAGLATVEAVDHGEPRRIWRKHGQDTGICRSEFSDYVGSRDIVSAIRVSGAMKFDRPIPLSALRSILPGFHPPQFYLRLQSRDDFSAELKRRILLGNPSRIVDDNTTSRTIRARESTLQPA